MRKACTIALAIFLVCGALRAAVPQKPADLPERYRDFQIYATSTPVENDPQAIILTLEMRNHGRRPLDVHALLAANPVVGNAESTFRQTLAANSTAEWQVRLLPTDALEREVLTGRIYFGRTPARELYVAMQGPDPDGFETKDIEKITARAHAVAAYAPSVPIDWWPSHPSSSIHPSQRRRPLLTLAQDGRSEYVIVLEPLPAAQDGTPMTLDAWSQQPGLAPGTLEFIGAARDLQRAIKEISGAELPITHQPVDGLNSILLRLDPQSKWPHPDAYHLHTRRSDVLIEAGHLDGLRQGIYGLLTDHLDCHWFFPGHLGEELPRPADRAAVIGQIDEHRSPSFFSVTGLSWGAARDWDCRNRAWINRGRMSFGHAWQGLLTPSEASYRENPDWWARDREGNIRRFDRGWSHTNFCTTNPQVIEIVARKINEQLRNPDVLVASLDPNDYAPMCLCDRCLALDRAHGVENPDGTFVTDRLLVFSKEIFDRLEPENKNKYLGILVYAYQMELPKKARPHAHHTGLICNMAWKYDHTRPFTDPTAASNVEFYNLLRGWGGILSQFGYYDYYGHWHTFGPWGMVHKMREDLPAFRDLGGTYLMIEAQPNFAAQGLNHYIAARLAWDLNADVDVLLEEFFAKYYGPAAGPMRSYWLTIERAYALERPGPNAEDRVLMNPSLWRQLDEHLTQAENAVAPLPEQHQRFKDRIAFHRDGFELGRRQALGRVLYAALQGKPLPGQSTPPAIDPTDALYATLGGRLRPGQVEPPSAEAAEIVSFVEESRQWLAAAREKYSGPYWPPFIASYFYPQIEENLNTLKAEAEKHMAPPATAQ